MGTKFAWDQNIGRPVSDRALDQGMCYGTLGPMAMTADIGALQAKVFPGPIVVLKSLI